MLTSAPPPRLNAKIFLYSSNIFKFKPKQIHSRQKLSTLKKAFES